LQYRVAPVKSGKVFKSARHVPSIDCGSFFLKFLPTEYSGFELGIIVTKKVGNAVLRNFVKRRLRNGVRFALHQTGFWPHTRIIVIAKKESKDVPFDQLVTAIASALISRTIRQCTPEKI